MMGVRENKVCSMIYKFWLGQWSKCMCHLLNWRSVEGGKNFSISVPVTIPLKWICVCVLFFPRNNKKKYGKRKERRGKKKGTE